MYRLLKNPNIETGWKTVIRSTFQRSALNYSFQHYRQSFVNEARMQAYCYLDMKAVLQNTKIMKSVVSAKGEGSSEE